jgi:hypothetical protein
MRRRALLAAQRAAPLAALLPLLLAGCLSIPVATIWKLRDFGPEQLFALDPTALRAALLVDPRVTMQGGRIDIDIEPPDKAPKRSYAILLQQPQRDDPRLPRAPAGRVWQVFAMSPQSVAEFQKLKQEFKAIPKGTAVNVRVGFDEGSVPAALRREFPVRLDLLLDPADGYFTMIKDTTIDLDQVGKS